MRGVATSVQIREAENRIIKNGVSEDELIRRAATYLYNEVISRVTTNDSVVAVVGNGNNGSDALECALMLKENGYQVSLFVVGESQNACNTARRERAKNIEKTTDLKTASVIIDGLFGIGLSRKVEGEYALTIDQINESDAFVISADIPSGLNADSGEVMGTAVVADKTLTFSCVKVGLLINEGRNYAGEIVTCDIGIESETIGKILNDAPLPKRKVSSHKGNYGRVKVIGGCETMVGAPLMSFESALAASRSGAGLTTLCVPKSTAAAYQARVKETMLYFLPDSGGKILFSPEHLNEIIASSDAIVIGPGLGKNPNIIKIVEYLSNNFTGNLIIDADGLNALSQNPEVILNHKCKLVLTPHVGEYKRLNGNEITVEGAKALAKKYDCVLCLKSATTIITNGEETIFNVTGTPALAKGGSGDVLCGIIASFSCVMDIFKATAYACYHFGKAGERASEKLNSEVSVMASDVIIEVQTNGIDKESK